MISRSIALLLLFLTNAVFAQELKPIFDGKTFKGWEQRGEAIWEIDDRVITGRTGKGGHGWLCTDRTYGDFILELEVKIESGNAGVQIRSHFEEGDKMVGYQVEVDPSARAWSGGLYEQGRRGWLQNLTNNPAARAAFKANDWNRYRIECRGDSFRTWINDVPATDYRDSLDVEGIIALQVHSGKNHKVQFRNIRIADLGKRKWEPLWDGATFNGWEKIGAGDWTIKDGMLIGTHAQNVKPFGHLISEKRFNDFTVRLKYKALAGNSGVYFRTDKGGGSGVVGFQAEVDATKDAGGLYETGGRAWVVQPDPKNLHKYFKTNDWNSMTVSAHGSRIAVDVNGFRTAEVINDPSRREGHFAFQLHGSQDLEVYFKDIEILSAPDQKPSAKKIKPSVQITEQPEKLRVELDGVLFTEYHFGSVPRPVLYPVFGPGQVSMTRDWPMRESTGEERDHPHHRGLWFTHGNVNGVDFWSEQKQFGKIVHDKFTKISSGKEGVIQSENKWISADGKLICRDKRTLRIHGTGNPRILDFDVTMVASEGDLVIGDTKEGSMAIRVNESMRVKPNSFNQGKLAGRLVQDTEVTGADTWGKRAAWTDYSGPVMGQTVGIAIFDHPKNPRHPTWWHVRDYGLFAANPFGVHDFEKKSKGEGDFKIPAGKSATFRYRFIFHEGDEKQANVTELYQSYSKEKLSAAK
ncbi:MAG: DUF1080 domain-containing protein [Verrucomicrobia bacterium]|nr:DUF1080 domain-containing protein [Verrucomicrobiota bacterium]